MDSDVSSTTMSSDSKKQKMRHILMQTACNGLTLFVLGLTLSMKGPSFIDLQMISNTDVKEGSAYFSGGAFGYMGGAMLAGVLYSRVKVKTFLIIIGLILSGITFALIPWCENFVSMLLMHIFVSLFFAVCETTINTEEVQNWEGKSDSAMHFLSFSYSLGGIVGPLIVEPFLAPKVESSQESENMSTLPNSNLADVLPMVQNISIHFNKSSISFNHTEVNPLEDYAYQIFYSENLSVSNGNISSVYVNQNHTVNSSYERHVQVESNIHYAFLIAGITTILVIIPYFFVYLLTKKTMKKKAEAAAAENQVSNKRLPLKMYVFLTGLVSILYFFYTTVDDPFSMYLSIFVVSHLKWSKENGALVSSLYWGSSTVTKLIMVVLVRLINPSIVLLLSTIGMTLSMTLLTVSAHFHIHIMIWVCTGLLALSQSAVFSGAISWTDAHLIKIDGKVTSSIMIFASLGAMLDPMLLGVTMKSISPMAFPFLLTFQAFITFLIFFTMLFIVRPMVNRKYGPPRPETCSEVDEVSDNLNKTEDSLDVKISNGKCNNHSEENAGLMS